MPFTWVSDPNYVLPTRVCPGPTGSLLLHDQWHKHIHFPTLYQCPGSWVSIPANCTSRLFKWTVMLLSVEPFPTWLGDTLVFQRLAQHPLIRGQIFISLTLYILLGYPLFLPPLTHFQWNAAEGTICHKCRTQRSKYFSFFLSLVSVTKRARLTNWPFSISASLKAR